MKMNRAFRNTIGFALLGIVVSALVIYVERNTNTSHQRNLPYQNLGEHVRSRMASGYLAWTRAQTHDNTVDFSKDIVGVWSSASAVLQSVYDGQVNELGNFKRLLGEDSKALVKVAINDIDKLVLTAKEYAQNKGDTTGVGENARLQIPVLIEKVNADAASLTNHFQKQALADYSFLNLMSWVSIISVVASFLFIGFMFYRFHQQNDSLVKTSNDKLNEEANRVQTLTTFIQAVSTGNYAIELQDGGEADELTTTLITMRDTLRENAENDKRRNWSTTGLAQIGEILRSTTGTSTDLYDKIIQFVVKYTRSNQGGLFILNEENEADRYLELVAAYAFERKKFIQKRIDLGEGLVGQCYLEGQRIYLLEVPQEYITITSGLGGSVPSALLIIPMKVNEKIFGVIELASFHPFQEYEIELVEKLAESIGSTISSVKINESTKSLLERTQQQAEEMRAQEEEMRQNMEELEATQEEMRRKEKHIQKMLDDEKLRNAFTQSNRKKLAELTKSEAIQSGDFNLTLEVITKTIAHQIDVSRCSIWFYEATENKIICEKLYQRSTNAHESGTVLFGKDFPGYFRAVLKEEDIVAQNAHEHPATKEFSDVYLKPLNIESMLDVPIFNEGKLIGVICCEHQHEQKNWSDDHAEFLKSCAELITVAYKSMTMNALISKLHNSQDTLQAIIDNIPRAIFWKDSELRLQGCNKIFSDVAGLASPREIVGKTDYDMPWKSQADLYRKDDLAVMQSGKARLNLEEVNIDSAGNESWVLTSKVPIADETGKITAVLGMFEDITERKKREADVAQKLQELEQLKKTLETRKG
ncbi:MAG: GAF domain-containing protein [Cyclobacteriaceae bacterium]|nr:GAF domain-containing protein [Cyclobacteriaceae bacterium]